MRLWSTLNSRNHNDIPWMFPASVKVSLWIPFTNPSKKEVFAKGKFFMSNAIVYGCLLAISSVTCSIIYCGVHQCIMNFADKNWISFTKKHTHTHT